MSVTRDRFQRRAAVVTGAATGIGAGVARRLADEGASVALLDISDTVDAAAAVERAGGQALSVHCDVRSPSEIDRALSKAEAALGPITLAVAAAGVIRTNHFLELSEEDWDLTLDANLKGTTFLLRGIGQRMRDTGRRGSMVALSSVAAWGPRTTSVDYGASKLGIISVCRSAAMSLAPYGITVNAVCPGVVDTQMTRDLHEQRSRLTGVPAAESLERMIESIPLGRMATIDEICDAILFLLSEEGSYITGQSLNICGGIELH